MGGRGPRREPRSTKEAKRNRLGRDHGDPPGPPFYNYPVIPPRNRGSDPRGATPGAPAWAGRARNGAGRQSAVRSRGKRRSAWTVHRARAERGQCRRSIGGSCATRVPNDLRCRQRAEFSSARISRIAPFYCAHPRRATAVRRRRQAEAADRGDARFSLTEGHRADQPLPPRSCGRGRSPPARRSRVFVPVES